MYYLAACPSGTAVPSVDPEELAVIAEQYRQRQAVLTGRLPRPLSSSGGRSSSAVARRNSLALSTLNRRSSSSSFLRHQQRNQEPAPPMPYSTTVPTQNPRPFSAAQRQKMYAAPSIPLRRGVLGDEDPSAAAAAMQDSAGADAYGQQRDTTLASSRSLLSRAMKSGMAAVTAGLAPSHSSNSVAQETGHGGGAGGSGAALGVGAGGTRSHTVCSRGFTCGLCLQKFGSTALCSSLGGDGHGEDGSGSGGGGGGSGGGGGAARSSSCPGRTASDGGGGGADAGGGGGGGSILANRRKQRELEQQHGDNLGNVPAKPAALVSVRAVVEMRNKFMQQQQQQQQQNALQSGGGAGADPLDLGAAAAGNSAGTYDDYDEHMLFGPNQAQGAAGAGKRVATYSGRQSRSAQEEIHAAHTAVQHGYETVAVCRFCAQFFGVYLGRTFAEEEEKAEMLRARKERQRAKKERQQRRQQLLQQRQRSMSATKRKQLEEEGAKRLGAAAPPTPRTVAAAYRKAREQQQPRPSDPYHDSLITVEPSSPGRQRQPQRHNMSFNSEEDDDDEGHVQQPGEAGVARPLLVPHRPGPTAAAGAAGARGRRQTLPFAEVSNDDDDEQPAAPKKKNKKENDQLFSSPSPARGAGDDVDDDAACFDYTGPNRSQQRQANYLASLRRRAEQQSSYNYHYFSPSATAAEAFSASRDALRRRRIAAAEQRKGRVEEQALAGEDANDIVVPMSGTALERLASRESLKREYSAQRRRSKEMALDGIRARSVELSPSSSPISSPIHGGLAVKDDGKDFFVLDDKKLEQENVAGLAQEGQQEKRAFGTDLTNQKQDQQQQQQQQQQTKKQQQPSHSVASATIVTVALSSSVVPTCVSVLLPRFLDASIEETGRISKMELSAFFQQQSNAEDPAAAFITAWEEKAAVSSNTAASSTDKKEQTRLRTSHFVFLLASFRTVALMPCCASAAAAAVAGGSRGGGSGRDGGGDMASSFSIAVDGMPPSFCISCTLAKMATRAASAAAAAADLFVVLDCNIAAAKIKKMWRPTLLRLCPNIVLLCPSAPSYPPSGSAPLGSLTASLMLSPPPAPPPALTDSVSRVSPIRTIQIILSASAASSGDDDDAPRQRAVAVALHGSSNSGSSSRSSSKRGRPAAVVFYELEPNASFLRRPSRALQIPNNAVSSCLVVRTIEAVATTAACGGGHKQQQKAKTLGVALLLDSNASARDISLTHAARMQRAVLQHFEGAEDQWDVRVCGTVKGRVYVFLMPTSSLGESTLSGRAGAGAAVPSSSSSFAVGGQRYPLPQPSTGRSATAMPSSASSSSASVLDSEKVVLIAAHVLSRRKREGRLKALAGVEVQEVAVMCAVPTAVCLREQQEESVPELMLSHLSLKATDEEPQHHRQHFGSIVDFLP